MCKKTFSIRKLLKQHKRDDHRNQPTEPIPEKTREPTPQLKFDFMQRVNVNINSIISQALHSCDKNGNWSNSSPRSHPMMGFTIISTTNRRCSEQQFMVDTGAMISLGTMSLLKELGLTWEDLEDTGMVVNGAAGGKMCGVRQLKALVTCTKNSKRAVEAIYFHPQNYTNIMSYDGLLALGVIKESQFDDNVKPEEETKVNAVLSKESKGKCKDTQFVNKQGEVECKCPTRTIVEAPIPELEKELDNMIEKLKQKRLKQTMPQLKKLHQA